MCALIALTGGIGSGKSVISRVLSVMGFPVYDCDSMAKRLMDSSADIKSRIAEEIAADAIINDGNGGRTIDRRRLADIVFADAGKLQRLNAIVHGAVRGDIIRWSMDCRSAAPLQFVETAILYTSGLDAMVDEVWKVDAPMELRINRAMMRDGQERHKIEARIKHQMAEEAPSNGSAPVKVLANDGHTAVLPQIIKLLSEAR